ncbi:3,4-dihydroxyphenylacetaldehyde synthase 2-like isoform X2 [Chrysoperla carnea]|uniref:3,4-dihydroxyphenylacetaldehyde synthase 2-like isoform X2 n=1 Tax=Chrysoperla carnea TaxID=189513 RepID=UPI001D088347|nr:3,4-dihydroxyphenylacetaldehyde synthase 2-like isoform X2 [Chrysoperla carnea]
MFITSPACTELEVAMMNWLGKLLDLPEEFLNSSEGPGGGIIQGSASEASLVGMLAAKQRTVRRIKETDPTMDEAVIKGKLVAYASNQSNSSVEKTGLLGSVPVRLLGVDKNCSLRGETLLQAVQEDIKKGFIPCYLVATFGTTGTCAFDNIEELAEVCQKYNIWLHIDAAYAGAALVCPEYRHLMKGIDKSDSFNFNLHKWLLVNFDCSAMWVKNSNYLVDTFNVDRIYLEHHHNQHSQNSMAPDYRHWQIPLGRRFRALKLWTTLRLYGVEGLQNSIRKDIRLAELFASYVRSDERFEVIPEPSMALVCFRLKGDDEFTKQLLNKIVERKKLYMVPATYESFYIIRYVVCSRLTTEKDIEFAWNEIQSQANEILQSPSQISSNTFVQKTSNMDINTKESFKISNNYHPNNITEKSQ